MLSVHSKFTEVIKSVFNSDQQFVGALDKVSHGAVCFSYYASRKPIRYVDKTSVHLLPELWTLMYRTSVPYIGYRLKIRAVITHISWLI